MRIVGNSWHRGTRTLPSRFLQLQARFLADNVDFASEVRESLANVKESVRFTREEGDPYNLLPIYQSDLEYLEEISSRPSQPIHKRGLPSCGGFMRQALKGSATSSISSLSRVLASNPMTTVGR